MRSRSIILVLMMLVAPQLSFAQQAPTGAHYGGRSSDTGYGGSVANATGVYSTSIPLDLPAERAGLPVPLQINYGTRGVGAAGLGWDIPFSYIRRDRTFAHRRPAYGGYAPPQPRERTFLSLLGAGGELVRNGDTWFVRTGTLELTVRESGGVFLAYDGAGRTYTFTQPAQFGSAGLWLLKSVSVGGGASVELTYQITTRAINGGAGLEVNLTRIVYNTSPVAGCAKHEIALTYGNSSTSPLSISMLGDKALVRFRVLTRVDVKSRATCASLPERLRSYALQYLPGGDPDTKLPRLQSVRMFGRQGTPEEATPIPVASYEYGSATNNGRLKYQITQIIDLPPDVGGNKISGSAVDSSVSTPNSGERYAMWQSLTDVTGDGRPDLVYKANNKLHVAFNSPADGGKTTIWHPQVPVPLYDSTFTIGAFSTHTMTKRRLWWGTANRNTVNVWRQAIDVNGDGRVDIVDAGEEPERWIVYLNMPGGPNGFKWERRSLSVRKLALDLASRGHAIDGGYVPLSRRTTGVSVNVKVCLIYDGTKWGPYSGTYTIENENGTFTYVCDAGRPTNWPQSEPPTCDEDPCPPPAGVEPEKTFIEWELTDLNGDSYPDFVFNSLPTEFAFTSLPGNPEEGDVFVGETPSIFQLPRSYEGPTNVVRVAYNIVGVRFEDDEHNPFARSVSLMMPEALDEYPDPPNQPKRAGVGVWVGGDTEGVQNQEAGFADVNGDGLVDRVIGNRAYLGVYTGTAQAFSGVHLTLPGLLSQQSSEQKEDCLSGIRFTSRLTQGLRDLTGDGIPDYFIPGSPAAPNGQVAIGTGTRFASRIPIVSAPVDFQFSHQTETCNGDLSNTDGGLFDIDGDGKPEVIGLVTDPANGQPAYLVTQLAAGTTPRAPDAGRVTVVGNGYGALTRIAYRSAKEDLYSAHQVPFPEIVVTSVETVGALNLGGSLAGTRYAYGNAYMIFDSARDAWTFPGYGRTVALYLYMGLKDKFEGAATVVDYWPLTPFSPGVTKEQLWRDIQRVGKVRDIYTLRGSSEVDPWSLLHIGPTDTRIIGVSHREWNAKLFEISLNPGWNLRDCLEIVDPAFDVGYSLAAAIPDGLITCRAHGFAFVNSVESWYGGSPPPSTNNVQARSRLLRVDDFGRVVSTRYDNDLFRGDDDVCIENEFATPIGAFPRVLTAIASRRVSDCTPEFIIGSEALEYDGLPAGAVSSGRLTSHTIDRRATHSGASLGPVRMFDATYDSAGNLAVMRTERDGAKRTVTFAYDPFGIVPIARHVDATGLPATASSVTYDPVSLDVLDAVSINGIHSGTEFDGFGRPLRMTISLPGGPIGVLSTISYEGFSGTDSDGRRIVVKTFSDPVTPANAVSSAGRTAAVFLDELGRELRTELSLGSDYGNESLVLNARVYDAAGRIAFQADPYPLSQMPANPYGTSYHFTRTGDLDCIIRGWRRQPLNKVTNIAEERLPTCFNRVFTDHVATLDIHDAASLQSYSHQAGVVHRVIATAIGRVIERSTIKAGVRLDYATFRYDRLGQRVSMERYLDPVGGTDPVYWSWRLDSTGQVLQLDEPESATRNFRYSDWGELVETQWMDGTTDRRLVRKYDALGRLTGTEERNDGVADPETLNEYYYDIGVSISPRVTPDYVLGRLAGARSPRGEAAFSYDAYGLIDARAFRGNQAGPFIEKEEHHADGSLAMLEFNLPDHNFERELVKYGYDSAGRLRSVKFSDALGDRDLYQAETIDVFGRIRKARQNGTIVYHADYADTGRRLIKQATVETPHGSRQVIFLDFDPVGRELSRREIKDGAPSGPKTNFSFDELGRLVSVLRTDGLTTLSNFRYDALGNIVSLKYVFPPSPEVRLSYNVLDRDRLCRIDYGTGTSGPCNVLHDTLGNIVSEPTWNGTRQFSYFSSGAIRTISSQGAQASFAYDAFGQVQELDVQGATVENRRDRRYGRLIEQRDVVEGGATVSRILRHIPGPGNTLVTRRGPTANWTFEFGELRGSRFFVNQDGELIQEIDYEPFGEATSTGAPAGAADYSNYQWNGGDAIAAFGLSHLGARIYDPVIGRFLSRDPVRVPRTATTTNPYAFAMNDPLNDADPSGLDCIGPECQGLNYLGLIPLPPDWPTSTGNPSTPPQQQQAPSPQMVTLPWGATVGGITVGPSLYSRRLPEGSEWMDLNYWAWRANPFNAFQPDWLPTLSNWPTNRKYNPPVWQYNRALEQLKEEQELARSIWGGLFTAVEVVSFLLPVAQELVALRLAIRAARGVGLGVGGLESGLSGAQKGASALRGISTAGPRGAFTLRTNAAGGKVYTTRGIIDSDDFALLVREAVARGEAVNILSGVHGDIEPYVRLIKDYKLYFQDIRQFAGPEVWPWNLNEMSTAEITSLLNGPQTTIAGFCYSGICLQPYMNYILP